MNLERMGGKGDPREAAAKAWNDRKKDTLSGAYAAKDTPATEDKVKLHREVEFSFDEADTKGGEPANAPLELGSRHTEYGYGATIGVPTEGIVLEKTTDSIDVDELTHYKSRESRATSEGRPQRARPLPNTPQRRTGA